MLNFEFSYQFYLTPNGHTTWCMQELEKTLGVQLHCSCYRLTPLSQSVVTTSWTASKRGREHRNVEDSFAIAVREHSDTRADDDVDDRPIVGHLPLEVGLISQLSPQRTTYLF